MVERSGRTKRRATWPAFAIAMLAGCSPSSDDRAGNQVQVGPGSTAAQAPAPQVAALAANPRQVEEGRKVFASCAMCHSIAAGVPSPAGPNLHAVVGRQIAAVADFPYSDALKAQSGTWTEERLDAFLLNPQKAYPGTAMAYGGLTNPAKRKAVIAYLASQSE